jgi:hypothetical protein
MTPGLERLIRAGALAQKQDRFVRLIAQGGAHWRSGRTILNTARGAVARSARAYAVAPRARNPRCLSLTEPTAIANLRRDRRTVREIVEMIGRSLPPSPATAPIRLRSSHRLGGRHVH